MGAQTPVPVDITFVRGPGGSFGIIVGPSCSIKAITPGTPAASDACARALVGGVITAVDGVAVSTTPELLDALKATDRDAVLFSVRPPVDRAATVEVPVMSAAQAAAYGQFCGTVIEQAPLESAAPALLSLLDATERSVCDSGRSSDDLLGSLADEQKHKVATDARIACQVAFAHTGGADAGAACSAMATITSALKMVPAQARFFIAPEAWVAMSGTLSADDIGSGGGGSEPLLELRWRWEVVWGLLVTFTARGAFDARYRTLLRIIAKSYCVDWRKVRAAEILRLEHMAAVANARSAADASAVDAAAGANAEGVEGWGRGFKIGAAAMVGGGR